MNETKKSATSRRRRLALAVTLVLLAVFAAGAWVQTVKAGTTGPDVTIAYLPSVSNWGSSSGIRGYSVGTTSCNVGDTPLWWCDNNTGYCNDTQHPVIGQNLYRLKDGRFEQIGMSWLKHGFLSLNTPDGSCGSCVGPPHGGDQLGVGCTDAYGSGLNGSRNLGMRSEVNATTGVFPYPETNVNWTGVDQLIKVPESELEPSPTSTKYWVEGQYVAPDDAAAGNGLNNASYREVTVSAGSYNLNTIGSTVRQKSAIEVWPVEDPTVELVAVDVRGSVVERFHAARKVTNLGGGLWHYEYAIHNLNSDRSGRAFTVKFIGPTTITNIGFHDVDHHSGEYEPPSGSPYDTTDWTIATDAPGGSVSWSTDTYAVAENANALRWGTTYSFWFDANRPPGGVIQTLELFKPGDPTAVDFSFIGNLFSDGFESGNTSAWSSAVP